MIEVNKALSMIHDFPLSLRSKPLDFYSGESGYLSENVYSDRAYPPFDRVAMDGIAISFNAYAEGQRQFRIAKTQRAGEPRKCIQGPDQCIEIMTGAALPDACDMVIPYEKLSISSGIAVIIEDLDAKPYLNVHREGSDYKKNQLLLEKGHKLDCNAWQVLASVGATSAKTYEMPAIALVATGDELIPPDQTPKYFQLRRSNVYALNASLKQNGFSNIDIFHLEDNEPSLESGLEKILNNFPIVILSGGVSAGKFDLVPQVLAHLGVNKVFHKINQKPGKPMWFGHRDRGPRTLVFGLPGNPVSALVCLHRYVIPHLLCSLSGGKQTSASYAKITSSLTPKKNMTHFIPVIAQSDDSGCLIATPVPSNGSGDFRALVPSTGFIEIPMATNKVDAGETFRYFSWRS